MGIVSRRNILKKRSERSIEGSKSTLEGIIIYVNADLTWANVKLDNDTTLYRIPFAEGINPRLKRLEQTVLLTQSVGKRYKYVISGSSRRKVDVEDFDVRGVLQWGATTNSSVLATPVQQWVWG